jgi:hypothetical protein
LAGVLSMAAAVGLMFEMSEIPPKAEEVVEMLS